MTAKIRIPHSLQEFADGQAVVELDGDTVGQCLDGLVRRFPAIGTRLFNSEAELFDYVDIYINLESTYPEGLARPVKDGDELDIVLFAIASG